jgi:hypothetical protein
VLGSLLQNCGQDQLDHNIWRSTYGLVRDMGCRSCSGQNLQQALGHQ